MLSLCWGMKFANNAEKIHTSPLKNPGYSFSPAIVTTFILACSHTESIKIPPCSNAIGSELLPAKMTSPKDRAKYKFNL